MEDELSVIEKHIYSSVLLDLDLDSSKFFTDLSIHRLLSPNLTYLNLGYSSMVSGKSFEHLPRSLTSLNLSDSESIFDSDIGHLPRSLKYLSLSHAIHLTDLCIHDLPPHLVSLFMVCNSRIAPSSFPYMPYSLRSRKCSAVTFATWSVDQGKVKVKSEK